MTLVAARQVADAVLYEGYLLYPYRASAAKNQVRWQFGVLGPGGAGVSGEPPSMSAQVLVEQRQGTTLDAVVRFLHVQCREVEERTQDGWARVQELRVAGAYWVPFHEAVPLEVPLAGIPLEGTFAVTAPAGEDVELLHDESGETVGRLVRRRWPLHGELRVSSREGIDPRLVVVSLELTNLGSWLPAPEWNARDVAARTSFVGTHLLLTVTGSSFVPLLDAPDWAADDVAGCRQERCWPVLVADDDGHDAVLVSPIVLGDHPSVAPESKGDLFDATEIDEILTLRVLTMTDQEKSEARGTDPRAAEILDRCEQLPDEALALLHGARRRTGAPPVGSRVLLRPSRRADAQDLFLSGLTAVVRRIDVDLEGRTHIAVVLEDDPGADLYEATGRFYYFAPDEIEVLS